MKRVLVTGADGFVGRAASAHLIERGWRVRAAKRVEKAGSGSAGTVVGEIGPDTDWSAALKDADAVLHLAARVHVMRETAQDPLLEFRRVNREGTLRLARAAAAAGTRRFVFVSTVKVNGEETGERPFRESDPAQPGDAYALSKWEAEQGLLELGAKSDLEIVIVRPPLVYGPGVKGNFLRLMRWVHRGIPLPLKNAKNRRSLLGLGNLVDFLDCCLSHHRATGEVFLIADGEDLSTADLIRRLAESLGRPARLLPAPAWLLPTAARIAGRGEELRRLLGSLRIDASKARRRLDWKPPISVEAGLLETARWHLSSTQ